MGPGRMGDMSYAIGGRILDLYDDVGLQKLAGSPHFGKLADLPLADPSKLASLEDRNFALVFISKNGSFARKYPIHDYAHTVLANVYFDMTQDQLPPEAKVAAATQIKRASVQFRIKPFDAVEKYASDEAPEGVNYVRLSSVKTAQAEKVDVLTNLKEAYEAHRDRYSREEKRALAKAMDEVGVEAPSDLKPFIVKNAEVNKEAFFSQCALRKQLVQDRPEASILLDEFLGKYATFDPSETVKLLETFDRQFGLDGYWTRGLEPNAILSEKRAYHSIKVRGLDKSFTDSELMSFIETDGALASKMFGKELVEKLQSDPGAVRCLPIASQEFIAARIEHARDNAPAAAE